MSKKPCPTKSSALSRRLQRLVSSSIITIWQGIIQLGQHFALTIHRIRRRDQLLAILLLIIWIVLLLGNFYFRSVSRFEGTLTTQAMSFTYNPKDNIDKRFLNSINNIAKLTITGKQPSNLTLNGKFSDPTNPSLNLKLQTLTHLDIQLNTSTSSLILEIVSSKRNNAIVVQELRISPNTQVEQLAYLPNTKQLKFCLQSSSPELNTCANPSSVKSKTTSLGTLKFEVNSPEINLYLADTKIPKLGIEGETQETKLRWQPENSNFILPLSAPTSLQINFPKTAKAAEGNTPEDLTRIIRGNIPVKNVRFSKLDRTGNVSDDLETSEILEGEVRMMGQSLKLQPEQFLIIPRKDGFDKPNCRMSFDKNPGIQRFRDIRINTKSPQGLQTLFTGESKCLAVGLYEDFPTQSIEPSWLLKYLPQEGINAIYTLIGAFTGILFPRLFPEKDNTKE
jgi:hypothetical protein